MKQSIALFLLLCACGTEGSSVLVELRTDLIPGIEFERIEVLRFADDGTELLRQEMRSTDERDFLRGARIANLEGENGEWLIEVRLRDAMDGLVVAQPILVTVNGPTVVTALISRECRGVECPAALGNATDTACLAGVCVSPRCTLESPEECGAPQCEDAAGCGSVECGEVECLDGYCFASGGADVSECGENQYCDVSTGCRAIPTGADMDRDRWNDFEDCDDMNARVHPEAAELCNGVDDDCDGVMDEGLPGQPYYRDEDGDGFGSIIDNLSACTAPDGYVAISGDCDDLNGAVFPGAAELCDGVDGNCDGVSDDQDGDGHSVDCEGGTLPADDCNDFDGRVFPMAPERCDAVDNDCDMNVDEAPNGWFRDSDNDGYGGSPLPGCDIGAVDNDLDCNDGRAEINPAAPFDACGGGDQDCDESIDEDPNLVWYVDGDGDGIGVPGETITSCTQPEGYGATDRDCDDADPTRAGGLPELCDGLDNDCDPNIDEDPQTSLAANQVGVCQGSRQACVDGVEVAPDLSLIADYEEDEATCELADNDCDGETDEGLLEWLYFDRDDDGYGGRRGFGFAISLFGVPELLCRGLPQVAEVSGDCADDSGAIGAVINPGEAEICDGLDQDCDGATDEGTCAAGSLCAGASGCIPEVVAPATLSGVIETDTAWQGGGDILVTGTVLIDSGASLSVGPGTRFRFADNAGFSVLGRLSAYGSSDAPVIFESASPFPTPTSWQGLSDGAFSGATINLSHCEVRDARKALDGSAKSCLFENNAIAIGRSAFGAVTCFDCVINATGLMALEQGGVLVGTRVIRGDLGTSRLTLLDSELVNPEEFGTSDLEIINSTIRGFPARSAPRFHAYGSRLESFTETTTPYYIVHSTLIDVPIIASPFLSPPFVATESSFCSTDGSPIVTVQDSTDMDLSNNHWCTTVPAEIDALIIDDADNASLGRANYTPFLTEAHPLTP